MSISQDTPMRLTSGRCTSLMKSIGGDHFVSVPPLIVNLTGALDIVAGRMHAWRTSDVLPAVPMSNSKSPPVRTLGRNVISFEPTSSPSTWASQSCATASIAARCWAAMPGFGLPALMSLTRMGSRSTAESATAVLRTCPPPSPCEPSISIISARSVSQRASWLSRSRGRTGPS